MAKVYDYQIVILAGNPAGPTNPQQPNGNRHWRIHTIWPNQNNTHTIVWESEHDVEEL